MRRKDTLFRLFFSIAITVVGLLLVYAKPLPNNDDQAGGGYLIQQQQQQQQQPYSAGKEFVVSYGGDDIIIATNYNLDNSPADELNTDSSPSSSSPAFSENPPNVTPTIQENPTLTTEKEGGGLVAWEWFDNFVNGLDNIGKQFGDNPQLTPQSPEVTPTVKDKFLNFPCGGSRSVCCSGQMNNPGIAGKHTCANKHNYWPLPLQNKNAESIPEGKLPCVKPVYLDSCSQLQNYASYNWFSDCKANQ